MKGSLKVIVLVSISLMLAMQGCGGGGGSSDNPADTGESNNNDSTADNSNSGYTGLDSQATVDESNAKDLAIAAASGIAQAVEEESVSAPFSVPGAAARSYEPTEEMHQQTTAEVCTQGGEAIVEEVTEETDHWVNVFSLNNCSYGEGLHIYTFTGRVRHTYSKQSNAFDYVMTGTVSSASSQSTDIDWRVACDANFRCNMSSDFQGFDGRSYRVTEIEVTDDGNSVYTAAGRIYDPIHGYIDVTTEIPFTMGCENGQPGSGRLNFTGTDQTFGYIEFVSCTEYVVATSNGTANSYTW